MLFSLHLPQSPWSSNHCNRHSVCGKSKQKENGKNNGWGDHPLLRKWQYVSWPRINCAIFDVRYHTDCGATKTKVLLAFTFNFPYKPNNFYPVELLTAHEVPAVVDPFQNALCSIKTGMMTQLFLLALQLNLSSCRNRNSRNLKNKIWTMCVGKTFSRGANRAFFQNFSTEDKIGKIWLIPLETKKISIFIDEIFKILAPLSDAHVWNDSSCWTFASQCKFVSFFVYGLHILLDHQHCRPMKTLTNQAW